MIIKQPGYHAWNITIIILFLQTCLAYLKLPDRIVVHLSQAGTPDEWASKTILILIWFLIIFVINIWIPALPFILKRFPISKLSIPNKSYWFKNQLRAQKCVLIIRETLSKILTITNVFIILAFQTILQNNMQTWFSIPKWVVLACVPVLMFASIIIPISAFSIPEHDPSNQ